MSFILDALRKSEHERQRTALPGIAQVPFGLPRRELPAWTIGVIVVLGIAVLALGGAWWSSARKDSAADAETAGLARTDIPLVLPEPAGTAPPATVYSAPLPGARDRTTAAAERVAPAGHADTTANGALANDATSPERSATAAEEPEASDELTLPSSAALAAEGVAVPPLRLELHAYSPKRTDRFVFINGTKYVEGATLAEGPRLVTIAPNGAVLVYLGHRFLLAQQ